MTDVAIAAARTPRLPRSGPGAWAPIALLGPSLLFATVFFIVPVIVLIGNSLSVEDGTYVTFSNYTAILTDEYYWSILLRTVRVSLVTTAFALLLGYPAALYLFFSESKWRRLFLLIVISPLFVSVIVRTYGWIVLLMPNGALGSILPASWNVRLLNTEGAIVLGLMHIYMPFMVLALNSALYRVDKRLLRAATSLGASSWQVFRDILMPLSLQGILSGCVVVLSISMTAFSTPILLGGTINKTMPYLVYQQNLLVGNWHLGSALALFLLCVTLLIVGIVSRVTRVKWEAEQR